MKKIKYILVCLAVIFAAGIFGGCAYEKTYKNNNTFQEIPEDEQAGQ